MEKKRYRHIFDFYGTPSETWIGGVEKITDSTEYPAIGDQVPSNVAFVVYVGWTDADDEIAQCGIPYGKYFSRDSVTKELKRIPEDESVVSGPYTYTELMEWKGIRKNGGLFDNAEFGDYYTTSNGWHARYISKLFTDMEKSDGECFHCLFLVEPKSIIYVSDRGLFLDTIPGKIMRTFIVDIVKKGEPQ